jgi:hypothetical protein
MLLVQGEGRALLAAKDFMLGEALPTLALVPKVCCWPCIFAEHKPCSCTVIAGVSDTPCHCSVAWPPCTAALQQPCRHVTC